ncbi:polysaccharide lyase family 8 super-sandwich domain-containing protein [Victivallis vadensis]|uniref:polysaccharide lyase family 8 super-sandwich domain-containing protein n=1 Tax=Victivallis vadensis TaxID=172901 RepID=UPI00266C10B8|nr:polysaccharide lyase family 8 super-sandwich domain-containing protein [Victivallis vadensis]
MPFKHIWILLLLPAAFPFAGKAAAFPVKLPQPAQAVDSGFVYRLLGQQRADGSWPDIDYGSKAGDNWLAARHLWNIRYLSQAYRASGKTHRAPEILRAAVLGLEFWAKEDFQSDNWWHQQIGTPLRTAEILLTLSEDCPPDLPVKLKPLLDRAEFDPRSTGQNRNWMARVELYKGILYSDRKRMVRARDILLENMKIVPPGQEGVQFDHAFHQHGPQLQFGNYGYAFLNEGIELVKLLDGTPLSVPGEKRTLLADYYFNGPRWTIRCGTLDLNACARYTGRDKQNWLGGEFQRLEKELKALFPNRPEWEERPNGNRYFSSSDFMVHRRDDYYLSLRMCSSRVVGSETVSNENMQGRLMGNGLLLTARDMDEYRNFALFWNYRKLPGITALQDGSEELMCPGCWTKEAFYNESPLVGGLSDGRKGAAMQELKHGRFHARKSFFFFDRYYVCIGSSIAANSATTLNSCRRRGDIEVVSADGRTLRNPSGGSLPHTLRIRHDNIEYLFLQPVEAELDTGERTAVWKSVTAYDNHPPVTDKVFSLSLPHPAENGGYCYAVRPVANDGSRADFLRLKTSSADIHGVYDIPGKCAMIAFFRPGRTDAPGIGGISSDAPLLVLIGPDEIHYAEPTWRRKKITLTVGGKLHKLTPPEYGVTGKVAR